MTKTRILLASLCAPLTLALAACGGAEEEGAVASSEPVAAVPAPEGSSWTDQVTRTTEGGWLVGNPEAPVKLVEYGSLTCPACANFSVESSEDLQQNYVNTGRVSFELRSLVRGLPDLILTRLLDCAPQTAAVPLADQMWADLAAGQSTFQANDPAALEAADALPPEQRLVALAQVSGVTDYFAARGISRGQAQQCLADAQAVEQLGTRLNEAAQEDQVNATPTFFLNGQRLEALGWTDVEAALQRAGARDS